MKVPDREIAESGRGTGTEVCDFWGQNCLGSAASGIGSSALAKIPDGIKQAQMLSSSKTFDQGHFAV